MSLSKYRLRLPDLEPEECRGQAMQDLLEDFKYSKNLFAIFQPYSGPAEVVTTGLNNETITVMTVLMLEDEKILKFLKLSVVSAEKLKTSWEAGIKFRKKAIEYIRTHFANYLPTDEDTDLFPEFKEA
jgi:hypothetical protein